MPGGELLFRQFLKLLHLLNVMRQLDFLGSRQ